MRTVIDVLQPLTSNDAADDNAVTHSPAVTSCSLGDACPHCLEEEDSWPAEPMNARPAETRNTRTGT